MGVDRTPAANITLGAWARHVADILLEDDEPAILVGHSRAGIVISQVAELVPAKIRCLVYLCAFLVPSGRTLVEEARADANSLVTANMVPVAGGVSCTVREDVLRDAFYGCCTEDDWRFARSLLSPEPLKPLVTPLALTDQNFGSVPRVYIECARDRAITLEAQRRMQAALPCQSVYSLDTDHSPFLSRPAELARLLGGL